MTIEDVINGNFKLRDYSEVDAWEKEIRDKYETICLFSFIHSDIKLAIFQANGPDFTDYFIFKPENFNLFFSRRDLTINNSKQISVVTTNGYTVPFIYNKNTNMLVYGVFLKPKLTSEQLKKYPLKVGKTQCIINWPFTPFNKKYNNSIYSWFHNTTKWDYGNTTKYLDIIEPNLKASKKFDMLFQKDVEKIKNLDICSLETIIEKDKISFRNIIWSDGLKRQLYRENNPSFSEEIFKKIKNVLNDDKKYIKVLNYYFLLNFLLDHIDKIEIDKKEYIISIPIPKISEKTNIEYALSSWYTLHTNLDEYDFMCFKDIISFSDINKIIEDIKSAIPEDYPDRDSKLLLLELLQL